MAIQANAERDLLLARLGEQRLHVLTQLAGLFDEQLRRPVLPSGEERFDVLGPSVQTTAATLLDR